MPEEVQSPERSKGDIVHATVKAAIGSIPLVGAAGVELFSYIVEEPFEKRRAEWMREVGDAIADLRDHRGVSVEKLRDDPAFTDAVLQATQAALRTRDDMKREALKNAVLNSALPSALSEAVRATFIRYVEELTAWHLRILDLFDDPETWKQRTGVQIPELHMGGPSHLIDHGLPELRGRRDLYDQWWRDLHSRGLVTIDQLHITMTGRGIFERRTTGLGRSFLQFIRSPSTAG